MTYKLSDMYEDCSTEPALNLSVTVLNINKGMNIVLMNSCKKLYEYSLYVALVRQFADRMPVNKAIVKAVDYCIEHDILREFLIKERKAVVMYSLYEYNQAGHMKALKEESIEKGIQIGTERGIEEGINNTIELISWLYAQNRDDDVKRASRDREYLDELFEEYNDFL